MPKYPEERKQAILRKMAPPYNMTVAELSIEEGISDATLYIWCKQRNSLCHYLELDTCNLSYHMVSYDAYVVA